jgi:hypothetical protein
MAAPTIFGTPGLSNDQVLFGSLVVQGTGLRPDVVFAWILAEGGPRDNPLNIGPHRHFGDPRGAAKATVALLHTPRYAPILRAAKSGDPNAQLHAIAASPWDAGHYGGDGRNLRGAFARVTKQATVRGDVGRAAQSAVGAATGLGGAVHGAETFLERAGVLALLYVALTLLALLFVALGAARATGVNPLRKTFSPYNPATAEIPF